MLGAGWGSQFRVQLTGWCRSTLPSDVVPASAQPAVALVWVPIRDTVSAVEAAGTVLVRCTVGTAAVRAVAVTETELEVAVLHEDSDYARLVWTAATVHTAVPAPAVVLSAAMVAVMAVKVARPAVAEHRDGAPGDDELGPGAGPIGMEPDH